MNVVSFFAGCGGLDLGFEQAGFHVVWANEFDKSIHATYEKNHANTVLCKDDLNIIDPNDIPDCDGFIGAPPCQSWSVGGKQLGLDDERGRLFLKYIELINIKKPKFFLIENVKGMLDDKFKTVFDDFVNRLENVGYDVQWALLDAVYYSIPQNRERVFFVGFRKELAVHYLFPASTCNEPITLEQAIGDMKEEPRRFSGNKINQPNEENNKNIKYNNHDVLTSKFGPFYFRGNRRRGWHQPSFTINATADFAPLHPASPKMMFYGHENWIFQKDRLDEYRRLSVRECARIQTFPDDFIFKYVNIKDAYKMIGNAVPPRLGKVIAKSILNALNHGEIQVVTQEPPKEKISKSVLVGYYKGEWHKRLILANKLYYVRSDGRKGSLFKEDCSVMPYYLLLHHKNQAEVFELEIEEPILADASFLKSLGFEISGNTYLCFRLKSTELVIISNLYPNASRLVFEQRNYSPYFTTIDKVIDN